MPLFFIIIFLILLSLHFLVFRTFRKFITSKFNKSKFADIISIYPFIVFNLPLVFVFFFRTSLSNMSPLVYNLIFIPFYIFQGAVIFIGLYLLAGKIIKLPFLISYQLLNRFQVIRKWFKDFSNKPEVKTIDKSRRAFLRTSAGLISGYAFIGATYGVLDSDDYKITDIKIRINNLPEELKGTTLSLLCDIHSGPFMKEELMKEYVDAVNDINSDLILIPGDLTNSQRSEVLPFAKAFRNLKASKGIFASLGNHDYFSDAEYIAKVVSDETPIRLLRNESEILKINGKNLCIIGVEDTRESGANYDPVLMSYLNKTVDETISKMDKQNIKYNEITKLMLFHKPYFINSLAEKNIDLVLSGHTHGGQIVLGKFGDVNISLAGAVSKYISGLYESGNSKMYISRGIGSVGLPIRINCPPEITKITLV